VAQPNRLRDYFERVAAKTHLDDLPLPLSTTELAPGALGSAFVSPTMRVRSCVLVLRHCCRPPLTVAPVLTPLARAIRASEAAAGGSISCLAPPFSLSNAARWSERPRLELHRTPPLATIAGKPTEGLEGCARPRRLARFEGASGAPGCSQDFGMSPQGRCASSSATPSAESDASRSPALSWRIAATHHDAPSPLQPGHSTRPEGAR
jgi:hypothetical protein